MGDIFTADRLKKELDAVSPETAGIGVAVDGKDVGIAGSVSKDLGKPGGWTFGATGRWMKKQGASVFAALTWSGEGK